jgi:hypothetical protein
MKKIIISILVICAAAQIFTSCKKEFLDETVYSSYAPSTLTDSLGFEASIVGLHNHFSNFFTYSDQQGWPSVWQSGTDIAQVPPTQKQGIEVPYYDYNQLISTDGAASYTWAWAYRMINNANIIIKNVENPSLNGLSQGNKNSTNAEAKFFRAYAYNMLATLFGGVPLVSEPLTAPKTDFSRETLDNVNNFIITDLTFAAANLPDIDNVRKAAGKALYSRINKAAAQQLLAEVYLRAGKPALAEQQCNDIINGGKFSLTKARYGSRASQPGDPFSDMFIYGNQRKSQGNKEAIWVMEMENPAIVTGGYTNAPQQRRNWGAAYYQIAGMKITDSLGGRGIGRMRTTNWVNYGLWEDKDMRNSSFNFRRKFYYNLPGNANYGKEVPYAGADTLFKICPHTTKWYQFDPTDEFGFAMFKDIIVMRLGETYLLLAEAQFKQGKLADAATSLNVVRGRANATPVTSAQVTMDYILDERVRELLAEENRRMTLMRTGTLVDRATRLNGANVTGLTAKHLLLPIPKSEIDLNKDGKLDQNPGY